MTVTVRDESVADHDSVAAITAAAFRDHPHSAQTETFILRDLRTAGAVTLALVAVAEGYGVVGYAAFSPVAFSPDSATGWHALGPLSVRPDHQRRGVGRRLVMAGLERLRALGAHGCVLVGDPGYYGRFGFHAVPTLLCTGLPPEVVLALPFGDASAPTGSILFHPAFQATA